MDHILIGASAKLTLFVSCVFVLPLSIVLQVWCGWRHWALASLGIVVFVFQLVRCAQELSKDLCNFRSHLTVYLFLAGAQLLRRASQHQVSPTPSQLKGWAQHHAEAEAVHKQFTMFLMQRTDPNQHVSISRSRGGHGDSNRTSDAEYKRRGVVVDVSALDKVIAVDVAAHRMHIQPGVPVRDRSHFQSVCEFAPLKQSVVASCSVQMDELARVALAFGVVPPVVLEFPGITGGGAVCGGGIESSSHKAGCFFDTVEELDIITGDGVHRIGVSRTNEAALFHALSVSFGSFGILTRLSLRVEPAPRYIHVRYLHFDSLAAATGAHRAPNARTLLLNFEVQCLNSFADFPAPLLQTPCRRWPTRRTRPSLSTASRSARPALWLWYDLNFFFFRFLPKTSHIPELGLPLFVHPPRQVGDNVMADASVPANVERVSLRGARTDPWFFWYSRFFRLPFAHQPRAPPSLPHFAHFRCCC